MDSRQLYVNIHQVLAEDHSQTIPSPEDYNRECAVHVARNSGNNISHITIEFRAPRARFFSCMTFDGTGDYGVAINTFAMPKLKIGAAQKALVLLSIIEYLITEGYLEADMSLFREKIIGEINSGVNNIGTRYDRLCRTSQSVISGAKVVNTH